MVAKSGDSLLKKDARDALIKRLIPLATVVTPNLPEASVLAGLRVRSLEDMKKAATNFWNFVVHERSYVIGGNSDGEQFTPKARLSTALGQNTTETCNTYNMLKLTRELFKIKGDVKYADYFERTQINEILAAITAVKRQVGRLCSAAT